MLRTRPLMRKIKQHSVMVKNLRIGETKRDTQRERERGTKNITILKEAITNVINNNNNNNPLYKGYKVTLYSD